VGSHFFVDTVVVTFGEEMKVKVRELGGFEGVGVINDALVFAFLNAELVVGEFGGVDFALEKVGVMHGLHQVFFVFVRTKHPYFVGVGEVGAHDPVFDRAVLFEGVGAQYLKGVVVLIPNDLVNLFWSNHIDVFIVIR
jgi:hypothetical protein